MKKTVFFAIMFTLIYGALCGSVYAQSKEKYLLPKSNIELNLELENEGAGDYRTALIALTDTALLEFATLFGGLPKKTNGDVYDSLTIKLKEVSQGLGGEADPEIIELRVSDATIFEVFNWEVALIHEILHLWSAETFRYVDDQEQWFNEGVTEYLTYRLATKLGIIKSDKVIAAFSIPIANYVSAKGLGQYSLRSAASTDKLKKKHYFLVYQGGFVAGMVLDHEIRSQSNGKFSLDDLMAEMYQVYSRENRYSSDSIQALIKETMGLDFSDFFKHYINGKQIIPVGHYFNMGDLSFDRLLGKNSQPVLSDMLYLK